MSESYGVGSTSKKKGSGISFWSHDIEEVNTPHNDALVIRAAVANYEVARVLVDSGSSVNIIFKSAFSQMQLVEWKLEAVEIALFGFAEHTVYPQGHIVLPLTFRTVEKD